MLLNRLGYLVHDDCRHVSQSVHSIWNDIQRKHFMLNTWIV